MGNGERLGDHISACKNTKSQNFFSSNLDPFFAHCNWPHNNSFSLLLPASIQWSECLRASLLWRTPQCQLFVCSLSALPLPLVGFSVVLPFCDLTLEGNNKKKNLLSARKQKCPLFCFCPFWCFFALFLSLCCEDEELLIHCQPPDSGVAPAWIGIAFSCRSCTWAWATLLWGRVWLCMEVVQGFVS